MGLDGDAVASPGVSAADFRRQRVWMIRVLASGLGTALCLGLVLSLVTAASHDRSARMALKGSVERLARTEVQLLEASTELRLSRSEAKGLKKDLRQATLQLDRASASIERAGRRVELQAGQIDVLRRCLKGVSSALNYVAMSDYYSAYAALVEVESVCQRAGRLL